MSVLGIDYGTSNISASRINGFGVPEAIKFTGHDLKMPSLALFCQKPPLIGFDARSMFEEGLKSLPPTELVKLVSLLVQSFKTRLRYEGELFGYTHIQILGMMLRKVKEEAEKACAPEVFDSLVLTHPVQFEEWKKEMLDTAAHDAGFQEVSLMLEPVAAAIGYTHRENLKNVHGMMVYDFGAGTFDVAYVMNHNGKFTVPLPPKGDARCGGDDIDNALCRHLLDAAKARPEMLDMDLLWQCRRWKELLSDLDSVPVVYNVEGKTCRATLTRDDLNAVAAPVIDKTIALTTELYEEIKANRLPVDFVLMIGGSSNIPLIGELMRQALPDVDIRTSGLNDIAVALGASCRGGTEVEFGNYNERCYCIHDGREIRKDYKYCIYCGRPNFYHTLEI